MVKYAHMNDRAFNQQLVKIAPDLRLLFDAEARFWGVYQIRSRHILVTSAPQNVRPWLLFHVKDEKGEFRLPDMRDLGRAAHSVGSGHLLWDKGGDWYTKRIEAQEQSRKDKVREVHRDNLHQVAKDVVFHQNVITNRGRDRHNVRSAGEA